MEHYPYTHWQPVHYTTGWNTSGVSGGGEYSYGPEGMSQPGFMDTWFNFNNSGYLRGFAVGAGMVLLLTNPAIQKALVSGVVKIWSAVQGGVEEVKEQIQDIKAEMSQKE